MADQHTGLPVRSEDDGTDERVLVKIQDATDPGGVDKTVEVSEKLVHNRTHGEDPAGTKVQLKLSEEGHANSNGDYDAGTNTEPSSTGVVAHDENATPDETHQNLRITASRTGTKTGMHVALLDEDSVPYSDTNPVPVAITENEGAEIHDFDQASAVAKDATADHDYVVANGVSVLLYGYRASGSGKVKAELQIGDGAVAEVFATKDVSFNSTATPNVSGDFFRVPIKVVGTANGTTIKLIKTNRDNQAQDLYSTFIIVEQV